MLTQVGSCGQFACSGLTSSTSGWCDGCSLKTMQVWELKWRLLGNSCLHVLRHSVC